MIKFLVFLSLLFLSFSLKSQWKDFGLWTQITLEKKLNKRFSLNVTESLRLDENCTQINAHYSQFGANFKYNKHFTFSLAYRNSQKFSFDESISFRQRLMFDAIYKFKVKQFRFALQERFQGQIDDIKRSENWQIPQSYLRTKLTLEYDLDRKITPFCSAEVFYWWGNYVDNWRFRLGFSYEMDKHQEFITYYMYDQDVQVNNPLGFYALGLSYKYSF